MQAGYDYVTNEGTAFYFKTNKDAPRYSVYLLYYYISTHTAADALYAPRCKLITISRSPTPRRAQFTCCTGSKVQILTPCAHTSRYKLITIDIANPEASSWKDILPQNDKNVLNEVV